MREGELSSMEARLIQAYRAADERARGDALDVLLRHSAKPVLKLIHCESMDTAHDENWVL